MKVVPPGGLACLIERCDQNLIGAAQAKCSKEREERGGTE